MVAQSSYYILRIHITVRRSTSGYRGYGPTYRATYLRITFIYSYSLKDPVYEHPELEGNPMYEHSELESNPAYEMVNMATPSK